MEVNFMRKILFLLVLFHFVAFSQRATPLQYLFMMKSFKPDMQKVGLLCDLSKNQGLVEKLQKAGFSAGVKIVIGDVKELKDIAQRFNEIVKGGVDFLWIFDVARCFSSSDSKRIYFKELAFEQDSSCRSKR
jgi:hypothetical protein